MDLFIFTPNGDASALDFLNDPFLPVNIVDRSGQYANIQLLTILSTDAPGACPFFNAIYNLQLMNADTVSQSQAENSFTFDVPSDQNATQYVVEGNLVAIKDLDGNYQLFEIRKVDEYHTDASYTEAYCIHAAPTMLVDEWVDNVALSNATAATALSAVLDGTQWIVGTVNLSNTANLTIQRTNTLSALAALVSQWGGEMQFRVEISGASITGMYVDWLQTVGNTTGKRFEYGKDISSVQRTLDTRNVKTALYGYGQQNSDGTYVNFANVTWSKANGDPVDKPPGQTWVGDPTALSQWGRAGGTRNRFGSFNDSQQTDPATLLHETWSVLQTVNTPLVSYQMSVVDLETMMGYSWESVRIGDTVNVIDTTFNPALRLTARVVQIQRDIINPDNTQITLGNFLPTLAGRQAQLQNVNQTDIGVFDGGLTNTFQPGSPLPTSQLQGIINSLTNEVHSEGGYVYITNTDGILVLNKPKDQSPTKALRLKGGIFAISNTQVNGQWQWTTFGTGDGFTANVINAGTLDASLVNVVNLIADNIKSGTIDASKVSVINLNAGNVNTGTLDASKVNVTNLNASNIKTGTFTAGGTSSGSADIIAEDANGHRILTIDNTGLALYDSTGYKRFWSILVNTGNNTTIGTTEAFGAFYAYSTTNFGTSSTNYFGAFTNDNVSVFNVNPNGNVGTYRNTLDDGSGNMRLGGSLNVFGTFTAGGTKSAAVKTKRYGWRKLYVMESPENWFEDFGEGEIGKSGRITIRLEKIFRQTIDISKVDYKVFVQGVDSYEFKVPKRTITGFTVEGPPGAKFMYRIIAKRVGYADVRLEKHRFGKEGGNK